MALVGQLSSADGLITALSLAGAGEGGAGSCGYQDGDLTTVTKPSGATTTFIYDDRRRVIAWLCRSGRPAGDRTLEFLRPFEELHDAGTSLRDGSGVPRCTDSQR
jgi:YD repeat-containing protein